MADVELAIIKQERLLSELLNTDEPTAEGRALLDEMRRVLARRTARSPDLHRSARS
jgi:hypothetical protein